MNTYSRDFALLIPCFNNTNGLITSLRSIHYPKDKCEIIVVDDGSTPALSAEELQREVPLLSIKILRTDRNQGVAKALNTGLEWILANSDAIYIARLDAGDTCHQDRFFKQVEFLNEHPEIALLGSWARFENENGVEGYDYITKITHDEILKEMHYKCSFIHPSVMFRKYVVSELGLYPTNYPYAEDYAFFWSMLKKYKGAVFPEIFISIIYSSGTVSVANYSRQLTSRKEIVKKFGETSWLKLAGIITLSMKQLLPDKIVRKLKLLLAPDK